MTHIPRTAQAIAADRARYEAHQKKGLEAGALALPEASPVPAPAADPRPRPVARGDPPAAGTGPRG